MLTYLRALIALFMLAFMAPATAEGPTRDREAEMKAAVEAAKAAAMPGPIDVSLRSQATMKLPAGYTFIPQPAANQMMKAMGNGSDPQCVGLVFADEGDHGFVVIRYIDSGYVKDDEAKNWKADEMLQNMKEGTEEGNKERAELGIPPIEVVGWVQPPTYDQSTHRLVWSLESRDKQPAQNSENGVNYNTYVLGREGYVSLNLVTGLNVIERDKPMAMALLENTTFDSGRAYGDFNASTDKVAEYGIAALVGGIAAKKLGLLAVIAAFFAKSAKLIGIAVIGAIAAARKFFGGKKSDDDASPAA